MTGSSLPRSIYLCLFLFLASYLLQFRYHWLCFIFFPLVCVFHRIALLSAPLFFAFFSLSLLICVLVPLLHLFPLPLSLHFCFSLLISLFPLLISTFLPSVFVTVSFLLCVRLSISVAVYRASVCLFPCFCSSPYLHVLSVSVTRCPSSSVFNSIHFNDDIAVRGRSASFSTTGASDVGDLCLTVPGILFTSVPGKRK